MYYWSNETLRHNLYELAEMCAISKVMSKDLKENYNISDEDMTEIIGCTATNVLEVGKLADRVSIKYEK